MKSYNKIKKIIASSILTTMLSSLALPIGQMVAYADSNDTVVENTKQVKSEDLDRKLIGYFADWAYKSEARGYFDVADLQWDELTHIQYSFGQVNPQTNKVEFIDKYAATEEDFSDHKIEHKGEEIKIDESIPYKGHMNIFKQMKEKYPDVKVTISVGGWAGSRGFYTMMDTDEGIDTFVQSCVDFVREYGLDGVDIDFEYPSSTSQSGNPDDFDLSEPRRKTINARYNLMMKKLNEGLDNAAKEDNKEYILSAAVAASSWVLGGVESHAYAKELDYLSMMSYDFHGGWNEFVGNQGNIYGDPNDKETAGLIMPVLSADWAFKYYRGILPSEKIVMGVPYYTRGWENVQTGPSGTGLNGTSNTPATGKYNTLGDLDENGNQIPAGVNNLWHVMNLMEEDPNLKVYWDEVGKVPYIWNGEEKVFLTFENEQSIDERLKYINEHNLGGALIWTMDGDYDLNPDYVEGSTNINEGKYTFGNTLTKRLSDGLKAMGMANKSPEDNEGLEEIAVEVEQSGSYDHPNYTYDFKITNYTDKKIDGGWELAFDLPKSAKFKSTWGGTFTEEDKGDFTRITLKSSGWQTLEPGASTNLQGMIGLCFSGVRNVTFNGMNPLGNDATVKPEENQLPVISGADDKTINIGDSFDALLGVTAFDKEDGDLTSTIKVGGSVDTTIEGKYTLTYSVSDSNGLTTVKTRTITVVSSSVDGDNYDPNKIYLQGDTVIYKGQEYKAKWWTQGENPDTSAAWEKIIKPNEDGSIEYEPGMIFTGGEIVKYQGKTYKAKWWTNTVPGSDSSWELII